MNKLTKIFALVVLSAMTTQTAAFADYPATYSSSYDVYSDQNPYYQDQSQPMGGRMQAYRNNRINQQNLARSQQMTRQGYDTNNMSYPQTRYSNTPNTYSYDYPAYRDQGMDGRQRTTVSRQAYPVEYQTPSYSSNAPQSYSLNDNYGRPGYATPSNYSQSYSYSTDRDYDVGYGDTTKSNKSSNDGRAAPESYPLEDNTYDNSANQNKYDNSASQNKKDQSTQRYYY